MKVKLDTRMAYDISVEMTATILTLRQQSACDRTFTQENGTHNVQLTFSTKKGTKRAKKQTGRST